MVVPEEQGVSLVETLKVCKTPITPTGGTSFTAVAVMFKAATQGLPTSVTAIEEVQLDIVEVISLNTKDRGNAPLVVV